MARDTSDEGKESTLKMLHAYSFMCRLDCDIAQCYQNKFTKPNSRKAQPEVIQQAGACHGITACAYMAGHATHRSGAQAAVHIHIALAWLVNNKPNGGRKLCDTSAI